MQRPPPRTRGSGASPHRGGARPSCRARAPVQRGGRIVQRRHHHDVARRHHHRLELGGGTAVRIQRGGSRGQEHHAACTRRPPAGVAGRAAPDRLGRKHRAQRTVRLRKDGSRSKSRSASPRSSRLRRDHRHQVARDITEANKTRQVLRRQTEELRRIFETSQDLIMVMDSGDSGSDQPELRDHIGLSAGGNDRPQRGRLHPSRPSRDFPPGNAGGTARAAPEDFRYALHSQERARYGCHGSEHGPSRPSASSSSADMTESRLAQETLRESEQLRARHHRHRARCFVQVDAQGIIRDWNTQAENLLGWRRDEALGKNAFGLMGRPDGQGLCWPCDPSCFPRPRGSRAPPRTTGQAAGWNGDHR